jgi:hypothetical protein
MDNRDDFAILHIIDGSQFLVDTTFNHETDEHELTIKFWYDYVNGYTSATLRWKGDKQADFEKLFTKLKNPDYAKIWLDGIKGQFKS